MMRLNMYRGAAVAAVALALTTNMTAYAAGGFKTLGTDASLDAPPGADLTSLQVGQSRRTLDIRIEMGMVPVQGSYPDAGIQWSFVSGTRTYVAEAHVGTGEFGFNLYRIDGSGTFVLIGPIDGVVDVDAGTIDMNVPFSSIGARRGTVVSGAPLGDAGDVEFHQHGSVATRVVDEFETERSYTIR
jgi:hypothetical protein